MAFQKEFFLQELGPLLSPYKKTCDALIQSLWTGTTELDAVCVYALQSGGKRIRPALVWMMEEALGTVDWQKYPGPGLVCEYFHTSSLIVDDLPCMDNDDFRRGVPTAHKKFSEPTALLSSFALCSEGFRALAETPLPPSQDQSLRPFVICEASRAMGIDGLLGGQLLDLYPPGVDMESLLVLNDKKTGALFELCFVLGWIFGGGVKEKLSSVRALAKAFGRTFQLLDDIDDYEQDLLAKKQNNFAVTFGLEATIAKAKENVQTLLTELKNLGLTGSKLELLINLYLKFTQAKLMSS